jgi:hypothetical protein
LLRALAKALCVEAPDIAFRPGSRRTKHDDRSQAARWLRSLRTVCMSRMSSALLTACAWVILLGLVVAAVMRVSVEAKERRAAHNSHIARSQAAH